MSCNITVNKDQDYLHWDFNCLCTRSNEQHDQTHTQECIMKLCEYTQHGRKLFGSKSTQVGVHEFSSQLTSICWMLRFPIITMVLLKIWSEYTSTIVQYSSYFNSNKPLRSVRTIIGMYTYQTVLKHKLGNERTNHSYKHIIIKATLRVSIVPLSFLS
jgi:hypothetical protein